MVQESVKLDATIIEGFVGSILSKGFDNASPSPSFHKELWELCTHPFPRVAVAAPRGHAKSTAGTLSYGLAALLFRVHRFVIIVSDTEAQAVMFVQAMAQELRTNEQIISIFGVHKNEKGLVEFEKDTESDIIVRLKDGYTFRVMAKGAEQKLRGLLWAGKRPDLIVCDDLENDELVMNKDRRDKLARWFYGALLPSLSPTGKIRIFGTILHQDSLLNSLMVQDASRFKKVSSLKTWEEWPDKRPRGWMTVKYRAHNRDLDEFLWPERFGKTFFQDKRADYLARGLSDLYSQEYLNEPIDEAVAYFKRGDLLPETEDDLKKRYRFYCTVDMAISEATRSDWTVFLIAGVDEDKVIHVKNVIRERLDAKAIVEYLLALQKTYEFEFVGIEKMMISQAIGPFLREQMLRENIYPNIVELSHQGKDKIQRARSIQARMKAKSVKFNKHDDWFPVFEDELLKFPRGAKDDQVDALAYLGLMLDKVVEAPTDEEVEEEQYDDERRKSIGQSGRSARTGY